MSDLTDENRIAIENFLKRIREEVIRSQESKGIRASGRSAGLLRVESNQLGGRLIDGSGTFYFQEYGRKAGKAPPLSAIYAWLEFKKYGLDYQNFKERMSLAYRIRSKIAKYGTEPARKGKPTRVLTDVIRKDEIDKFVNSLQSNYKRSVTSQIIKDFQ